VTTALPALLPQAVREGSSVLTLERGQMLFRVGEPVEHIHYVTRGEVLAVRYLPDGAEAVMQRARAGEFFAQSAMAAQRYSCDARAAAASEIVRLPVRTLTAALASDGSFALAFALQLAGDLRRQCTRVERLRIKRARDRVRHYLVCEGPLTQPDFTLQDWARELGLEPETLYRALAALEAAGEVVRAARGVWLAGAAEAPGRPPGSPSPAT
jgi:CRP-like cAMP-binding protein